MTTIPNKPPQVALPWRVIVDTAEQHPFSFDGIHARGRHDRTLAIETVRRCLGRAPQSKGDYSIESLDGSETFAGICGVERKSLHDFQSTMLEFARTKSQPNCKFHTELANLKAMNGMGGAAIVVVECDYCEAISTVRQMGTATPQTLAATIQGAVISILSDYHVPILFAGSRRMAEIMTFRFLERFWRKSQEAKKRKQLQVAEILPTEPDLPF